jgi:hypothetical protein
MIYQWESLRERLLRFMRISPKKKMEWLREMQEFTLQASDKRTKAIRLQLRRNRTRHSDT